MEDYTNRELGIMLKEIKNHLISFSDTNKEEHKDLTSHIKNTNGRVKSLEMWRSFILGGLGVIGLVLPFVLYKIFNH